MEKEQKDYFKSNMKILEFAMKQWKFLGGIAIVAGILAGFFSGPKFITPQYQSEAVIYPANLGIYSGETRLEQMQQYCQSNVIRDHIIREFNLYDEYEIDSSYEYAQSVVNFLYSENIGSDETRYESINIHAVSSDPIKARNIVNEIIDQLNITIRKTERVKYKEALVIAEGLLTLKKNQVDSLEKIISEYSLKYGILDYLVQTEEVTKGYMRFLLEGKKGKDFEEVKTLYDNLKKHGRYYHNVNSQLNYLNDEYMKSLVRYEESYKNYHKIQTHSYVLVKPDVPDKKTYPVRWLIVIAAMASAAFFGFVVLLIKGYNNK
jgi:capsule polysaccharide export protein KpsE/RkpR